MCHSLPRSILCKFTFIYTAKAWEKIAQEEATRKSSVLLEKDILKLIYTNLWDGFSLSLHSHLIFNWGIFW